MRNLPRDRYLGVLNMASVIAGDSSSGIMEAPTFGTPCVNIGRRQQDRPQACNVINVGHSAACIVRAICRAMGPGFAEQAARAVHPYG